VEASGLITNEGFSHKLPLLLAGMNNMAGLGAGWNLESRGRGKKKKNISNRTEEKSLELY